MKHWTILLALLLVGCERVYESEFIEQRGLFYVPTETEPFTGTNRGYHLNGELEFEDVYKDGKPVRVGAWHDNGLLRVEQHYKDGKVEGTVRSWYRNGELQLEAIYIEGKKNGITRSWYESGEQESEINYSDGEAFGGKKVWDEEGELFRDFL